MFNYPTSRQFPVDEVCEKIVRELAKRNWNVPGISVDFDTYGSSRQVNKITGSDFRLWFLREQEGGNSAAVHELVIPRMELSLFDDESGPTLSMYVGNNWDNDKRWFMSSVKTNTKLNGEPRRHLRYDGSSGKKYGCYYPGRRPQYLAHNDDLGREYGLEDGDPAFYLTQDILLQFKAWLEENVLKYILEQPIPTRIEE